MIIKIETDFSILTFLLYSLNCHMDGKNGGMA